MNNIPQNPIFNHPLHPQNLNQDNPNNNANPNQNIDINEIDMSEPSNNNNESNQLSEEQKEEIAVENEIRDHLKCYICLSKVKKPKMCKFCKRLCCSDCINSWLTGHDYCGICKRKVTLDDLILVPFVDDMSTQDDMSTYFINNIENHPKHQLGKIDKSKIKNKNKTVLVSSKKNKNEIINNNDEKEENNEQKICQTHGNKIDYYCVQCDKYFCSNCLVFFGQEVMILQVAQMNDLGILEAVNEYKKLPETKNTIEHFIGLCNLKLKENKIKRCEFEDNINIVKNLYIKKLEDSTKDLENILNNLKNQKDRIDGSIGSIPNGFNNIVNSNDHAQGDVMTQELKKLNKIDKYMEVEIKEKSKMKPKLFIENYETDFIEIKIPYGGQYNEGAEIFNQKLNIIPNNLCKLNITYLQNQVYISLSIDINLPLNSPEYPKFYSYVILRNQKYGLEFRNLSNQVFPQDFIRGNSGKSLAQQINNIDFDFQQFIYLSGEEKIIKMKIFITKVYFKE